MKPFTDYTAEDFNRLVSTNLGGFIYMTQSAIKQMLAQNSGGSIVSITASLADNPSAGVNASIPMVTKGGIDTITRCLAIEYAKDRIRVNAVAPGVVDTPLHRNGSRDFLRTLSPMGSISNVKEIVDAVIYLTEAPHVTGEVLHVVRTLANGERRSMRPGSAEQVEAQLRNDRFGSRTVVPIT